MVTTRCCMVRLVIVSTNYIGTHALRSLDRIDLHKFAIVPGLFLFILFFIIGTLISHHFITTDFYLFICYFFFLMTYECVVALCTLSLFLVKQRVHRWMREHANGAIGQRWWRITKIYIETITHFCVLFDVIIFFFFFVAKIILLLYTCFQCRIVLINIYAHSIKPHRCTNISLIKFVIVYTFMYTFITSAFVYYFHRKTYKLFSHLKWYWFERKCINHL